MNRLTRLVLKRPVTTLLAVLALVVFGFSSLTTLRLELMPDMEMPMKIVYTVYPGADSESVDDRKLKWCKIHHFQFHGKCLHGTSAV